MYVSILISQFNFTPLPTSCPHAYSLRVHLYSCSSDGFVCIIFLDSTFCCCCSSVTQSWLTFCNPMDCSIPGLPVPHHLPESVQDYVHCIGDAIQPTHPLTPSSPSALNLYQHQVLFQWANSCHQMFKVLELQFQLQSFQWICNVGFLQDWPLWSWSPRDSCESAPAAQFESIISLVLSLPYGPTLRYKHDYWKNHSFDYMDHYQQSDVSAF